MHTFDDVFVVLAWTIVWTNSQSTDEMRCFNTHDMEL